jgi:hypothetical protein
MTVAELMAQLQGCESSLQVKILSAWGVDMPVESVTIQVRPKSKPGQPKRAAESWVKLQPRATL